MSSEQASSIIHGPAFQLWPLDFNNKNGIWRAEWNFLENGYMMNKFCLQLLSSAGAGVNVDLVLNSVHPSPPPPVPDVDNIEDVLSCSRGR